jgi:hypothetical protein
MNVLKAYRSLTAEQKRALRDKKLDLNRPVGPLLEFLKPLAACDAMSDKVRTKLGCTFGLAIVATIALAIASINRGWPLFATILLLAVVVVMLGSGYLWRWTRSIDVSNNFRQFMLPVLTVLREDIDPAYPVHVKLDLTAPTAPVKKRGESAPYKQGAYYKIIDKTYVDDWMSVDALLVDGTKLSWRVSDSIRERSKTKRNPRGKHKTKTKYKKKSDIEVSMGLRKKTYALAATEGEVSNDEKRNRVKVSREVVSASLDPIDPRALLDLVADVFRTTRPAKEAGA